MAPSRPCPASVVWCRLTTVYSICPTKKLLERVGAPVEPIVETPSTILGNWYATVLFWRPQVALLLNQRTLVSVLMPLAPARTLGRRFPLALAELLRLFGVDEAFIASESAAMADPVFARTQSRSLLGVINQSSQALNRMRWFEEDPSLEELALRLAYAPSRAEGRAMACPDETLFDVLDSIHVRHGDNPVAGRW